jgi:hypothetical protein
MGSMYERERCSTQRYLKEIEEEKNEYVTRVLLEIEGPISELPTECLRMIAEFVPRRSLF